MRKIVICNPDLPWWLLPLPDYKFGMQLQFIYSNFNYSIFYGHKEMHCLNISTLTIHSMRGHSLLNSDAFIFQFTKINGICPFVIRFLFDRSTKHTTVIIVVDNMAFLYEFKTDIHIICIISIVHKVAFIKICQTKIKHRQEWKKRRRKRSIS